MTTTPSKYSRSPQGTPQRDAPMTELNVVIGVCDRCGRDIRTNEARHKVNGLWEHDHCPIVSLHHFDPEPAA